jgi:hypothetical protein
MWDFIFAVKSVLVLSAIIHEIPQTTTTGQQLKLTTNKKQNA